MKFDSAAACRIFSAEDCIRWALAAYYGASRDIEPPPGEPWDGESGPWSSPALFIDAVHRRFTESLNDAAITARIPCDSGCACTLLGWDDSAFANGDLIGLKMHDLPPVQNAVNNQSSPRADHA